MSFLRNVISNPVLLVISLLSLCITFPACQEEDGKAKSSRRDREIKIDGNDLEWQGVSQLYDEENRTVVSFLHDDKHLFVRLTLNDKKVQRQILVEGLTVWFEQPEEKDRRIGVHFPVGLPREQRRAAFKGLHGKSKQGDSSSANEDFPQFKKCLSEIQLWGPGEYQQKTMPYGEIENYDVAVRLGKAERNLIYELKIPFGGISRFGLVKAQGNTVRVGFKTGDEKQRPGVAMEYQSADTDTGSKDRSRGGRRGGMGGGGMGGGRKGNSGGPMGEKRERESIKPLALWVTVLIAEKNHQE